MSLIWEDSLSIANFAVHSSLFIPIILISYEKAFTLVIQIEVHWIEAISSNFLHFKWGQGLVFYQISDDFGKNGYFSR